MTIPQALQIALQHHRDGRLAEAETLYRQILAVQPKDPDALHLLGMLANQVGRHEIAADLIRQAIAANPVGSHYYLDLGNALLAQGHVEDAVAAYRVLIRSKPNFAMAHNNLGAALKAKGELDEAIASYRRALEIEADYADFHNNLGVALQEKGQFEEATSACRSALRIKPDHIDAWYNLGIALQHQGRLDDAIGAYGRALQIRPDYAQAINNLGAALREAGHLEEAIAAFRRALHAAPESPDIHNNLSIALRERGQLSGAVAECRRALELRSDYLEAHNNLGVALAAQGQLDEAVIAYRHAIELRPDYREARNNLGTALKDLGQLDAAIASFRSALPPDHKHPGIHSNLVYTLHFHPAYNARAIAEEQRRWNRQFGEPLRQFIRPHTNERTPERRLRIGYVSPEFRDHVTGRYLIPLFQCHDLGDFEILCYAGVLRPDTLTERIRQRAQGWRSTAGVEDEALAELIRRDGVDILVDLTQHLDGNRLPMFARKPAPVQVSFAGYPDTTGLETIEYRISDRYLEAAPPDEITARKERVCLIDTFWCYDPCGVDAVVNELPAREGGRITFGCLNNFCKINEPTLRRWARVLGNPRRI